MNQYIFDRDTRDALAPDGAGRWSARISDQWNIDSVPNGGYLMALCLAAMGQEVSHPDPLAMNSHFLGRTMPGEATIRGKVIKQGRSLSVTAVDVIQNGRVSITSLITWGELSAFRAPAARCSPRPCFPMIPECEAASTCRSTQHS